MKHVTHFAWILAFAFSCAACRAEQQPGIENIKAQDSESAARLEKIKSLKVTEADGANAIELLVPMLGDESPAVQQAAAASLRALAARPKSVLPGLVEAALLRDIAQSDDPQRRAVVAGLFGEMKSHSDKGRAALIKWIDDPQPDVRRAALTYLIRAYPNGPKNGEFRDPLVAGLNDKDAQTRRAVALEFGKYGKTRIDVLVKVIENDPPRWVYAEALLALGTMHPKEEYKKVFVDALRYPSAIVRERALTALEKFEPDFVANSGLLDDRDSALRIALFNRVQASVNRKPTDASRKAFAKLTGSVVKALSEKDDDVRFAAARAARRIAPGLAEEVRPLLKDDDANVRQAAVQALGDLLDVDSLKDMMSDGKTIVRDAVAAALAKRGAGALPTLAAAVRSKDDVVQRTAAKAITASVARADSLIPVLVEALLAEGTEQSELAAALLRVDPVLGSRELARKADAAILLGLLKNAAPDVQILACASLAEKGVGGADAAKALAELVDQPKNDVAVVAAAMRALQVLAPKEAAPLLTPDWLDRLVKETRAKSKALRDDAMAQQLASFDDDSMETILAALATGEFTGSANDWLMHHCSSNTPLGLASPSFVRALALYGTANKRRLDPATELALKEFCWRFVNEPSARRSWIAPPLADAKSPMSADRLVWGTSFFLVLDVLKDDPEFKHRKIRGESLGGLHRDWSAWWLEWARQRQSVGAWSDLSHPKSQLHVWASLLNVYDCAKDPALKQRFKMLLDVSLVEDEQLSVHGDRGSRRGNSVRPESSLQEWKDLLLGEPSRRLAHDVSAMRGALWTTSYEAPTPVVLLRKLERPVTPFSVKNHRLDGGALTAHVTPHYVLAAHTNVEYYVGEFAGAWDRLVFDDMSAVFFMPRMWRNESLVFDNLSMFRCVFAPKPRRSIAYSTSLTAVDRKGWLFLSNGSGYAALFFPGGYDRYRGNNVENVESIQPRSTAAMVIVQAGDKKSFGSFEQFQTAILQAPLRVTATSLQYTGPRQPAVEFFTDWKQPTLVAGAPYSSRSETMRFESPYLTGRVDSPQVTIRVGPYAAVYDFERNTIETGK